MALLGMAEGDTHGGLLPFPKAWNRAPCRQRAALAPLPGGSLEPGAGCCTADPWGPYDPVMPDMGNTRRERLGVPRWAMPALACQPRCSGARQVFSLQDLFQPRLEEPVLFAQAQGKGCPATVPHLPPPSACLPASCSLRREGEAAPIPARSLRVLPGGESPHFMPAPLPCSWQPGGFPVALACTTPRAGELWARGFPTEEPEQFGKAVTSLWPGENGM